MSKLSKAVKTTYEDNKEDKVLRKNETVTNFMGGDSYTLDAIDTLKMMSASSIFGEPSYYVDGNTHSKTSTVLFIDKFFNDSDVLFKEFNRKNTAQIMEEVIDNALDFNFEETLKWAVTLRKEYNMRLNPQVIMVRASMHPSRTEFTKNNPGMFDYYNNLVMSRADEPMTQVAYFLSQNNSDKNCMPTILKKSIAKKLSGLSKYNVAKYKNHEIGMINAVRITHANSPVLDELMKTGKVEVSDDYKTWENLRSGGMSWKDVCETLGDNFGHMARLRNLSNVFTEVSDTDFCHNYCEELKKGVLNGKQFPFRYYSAYNTIDAAINIHHKGLIKDTLENCIDISVDNMPKLKGRTMCLSDNSGSAWGTCNSEYGTVTVASIDNLSSIITSMNSDEGYVGVFGDKLKIKDISKRNGVLSQLKDIDNNLATQVGGSTEGGIWVFFNNAINNKEFWDNIFIYSDQQAGLGGLYGTAKQADSYCKDYACHGRYINVYKLILEYRKRVNPKVNVFSVQTGGYINSVVPTQSYRCNIMYGWTGKELIYADNNINIWNEIDSKNN